MPDDRQTRPPRGALAVVAVGLIATLAAAALANENLSGEAAALEWAQAQKLPDSKPATVPGGGGEMQLTRAAIHATGVNVSGYSLFSSGAVLNIDAGAPVGSARIQCAAKAGGGTEIGQTPGLRASYPRSSEELAEQPVPESGVQVEFSSHGAGLAEVTIDGLPHHFAVEPGIKLEWPAYKTGVERWRWFLPPGPPKEPLALPFVAVWRTTKIPSVEIACTVTTSAGTATVRTAGGLSKVSEQIAE